MSTKTTDDLLKDLSRTIALLLVGFGTLCLQTWLVTICAGFLAPAFTLGFWQWFTIVATFRLLIWTNKAE
jgi:hypothetical protein